MRTVARGKMLFIIGMVVLAVMAVLVLAVLHVDNKMIAFLDQTLVKIVATADLSGQAWIVLCLMVVMAGGLVFHVNHELFNLLKSVLNVLMAAMRR